MSHYALAVVFATAVANSLNLVSTQQIMSNWFPRKKGIALGWATMGTCFSSAIMVAVFQGMFSIKISAPFTLMFIIMIVMAVVMIVWFKAFPEEAGAYPDNEPLTEEEKANNLDLINNYESSFTIGKLFKTKEMWLLALMFGFIALGLVAAVSQMIPRLMAVGIDQNMSILWLTIASVIGIRSCAFLIVPILLAMAGENTNAGYCRAFILCAVLSAIAVVFSFIIKGNCIGKTQD